MRKKTSLSPRKTPVQARSRQMREDILTASVRVLSRHGFARFTTPRVAAAAGISVGSLYQYFPNKLAILHALHRRTVDDSWIEVQAILDDPEASVRVKLRLVARHFFHAEAADVAQMGHAALDIDSFFSRSAEARALGLEVLGRFERLLRDALPPRTPRARVGFYAKLVVTVFESVGKSVATMGLSPSEIDEFAAASADMVSDFAGLRA